MLPATRAIPRELSPVYDCPIIEHVVKEAIVAGITEIILVARSSKETILGAVKNIIRGDITVTSVRRRVALELGHVVLWAKHLLNNETFAVLLPDVLLLDQKSRDQNSSFGAMTEALNETGIGQVMVERVDCEAIENCGCADLGGATSESFKSIPLRDLVEKPEGCAF